MEQVDVIEVGREALVVVLQASGPIMIAGLVVGVIISLIQALTSIQEMTLTFVPKIIVIFISLVFFLPFMMSVLIDFTHSLFDRMVALG